MAVLWIRITFFNIIVTLCSVYASLIAVIILLMANIDIVLRLLTHRVVTNLLCGHTLSGACLT